MIIYVDNLNYYAKIISQAIYLQGLACGVPKLFRTYLSSEPEVRDMKLNKRKIHWIIRKKKKGMTTSEIARDMKISPRRVQQVWKQYLDTGIEPVIGKDIGRPIFSLD
jgi:putative transposase